MMKGGTGFNNASKMPKNEFGQLGVTTPPTGYDNNGVTTTKSAPHH